MKYFERSGTISVPRNIPVRKYRTTSRLHAVDDRSVYRTSLIKTTRTAGKNDVKTLKIAKLLTTIYLRRMKYLSRDNYGFIVLNVVHTPNV